MMRFETNSIICLGHEQIVRYQSKVNQVDLLPSGGIA